MQSYYPTIEKVLRYFKLADAEKLENRNVRPLMEVLQKIAYFSPRIAGHILTRRTAIQSFEWRINDNTDPERSIEIKSKLANFINQIIYSYIDAVIFGIMALEYDYLFNDNWQIPKITNKIHSIYLDYQYEQIYKFNINDKKYYELNPAQTISFIYNPHVRGGILRTVLVAEILRHSTTMEWANLNKLLKGIITSIIDPDRLTNAKALMQLSDEQISSNLTNIDTAVQNAEQYNYVRSLNFAEIKGQSIADAQSGSSYKMFIEALNNDIAIAFLGQANTTELPNQGGSRAALNVLNLIRSDILFADLLNIKVIINKFLLQFYQINFNPSALQSPLQFEFVFDDNEDVEANARTFEYISRIGGVAVNSDELYLKLGLTRPEGTSDLIILGERAL